MLDDNYQLYLGDCLEVMKDIPDGSVDMVLCDPPYGTTACKWDSVIPFDEMWNELKRVSKDNSVITLFGSQPFTSLLITSNLDKFKYTIIWEKTNPKGFLSAKKKPLSCHEDINIFCYGCKMTYNPQMWKVPEYLITKRNSFTVNSGDAEVYNSVKKERKPDDGFRFPTSVLGFANHNKKGHNYHPTQKPVELMEYLIKTYSNEGDTILDFTMGSGTTGVACMNTNRKFIGIEKEEKYFDIAKKRIEDATQDPMNLFFKKED